MKETLASTVAQWVALAEQHEAIARAGLAVPLAWGQCVFHFGLMVECLMKARIMMTERFETWPSITVDRGLYTHDLRKLAARAAMPTSTVDPIAPSLHIVLQWDRNPRYEHRPPPRAVVDGVLDAALGPDGVATWLRRNLP